MPRILQDSYVRWSLLLLVIAVALVLLTFRDYGVTWDEFLHVRYGNGVFNYFASGLRDHEAYNYRNLFYYGAAFDLLCAVASRLSPLDLYDTRHLLNAMVALLGVVGCWFLARELGGPRTALIACVLLLATPRWWGHGFNNPKDIPFAAAFVWSMLCIVRLTRTLPLVSTAMAVWTGLAIGAALSIRIGGLMLLGYVGLAMLASLPRTLDQLARLALGFAQISLTAWTLMMLLWPWAQLHPLWAPLQAFLASSAVWGERVLFAGREIEASQIPASYIARWLLITLPEILLAGLALALVTGWREGRQYAFVAFGALFPIVYLAIQRPSLYDGMRHVLFVVPLLCCLAARALERSVEWLSARRPALGHAALALIAVYLVAHVTVMVRLHPNQVVYFNSLVGGLPGAYGRYETDYWGNSYREAVGMLVERIESESDAPPPYRVFVCSSNATAETFFPDYLSVTSEAEDADFLIGTTRWNCHRSVQGEELAVVERLGTPLNFVIDRRHLLGSRRRS